MYLFMYDCAGSSLLCGLSPRCRAWASHCRDFSCCGARALGQACFGSCGHGLSSCSFWTREHRLSRCGVWPRLLCGMWDLPRSGTEPVSPALPGSFFTTKLTGKTPSTYLSYKWKFGPLDHLTLIPLPPIPYLW